MAGFKGVFTGAEGLGKGAKAGAYDIFEGAKGAKKVVHHPLLDWIYKHPKLAVTMGIGSGAAAGATHAGVKRLLTDEDEDD